MPLRPVVRTSSILFLILGSLALGCSKQSGEGTSNSAAVAPGNPSAIGSGLAAAAAAVTGADPGAAGSAGMPAAPEAPAAAPQVAMPTAPAGGGVAPAPGAAPAAGAPAAPAPAPAAAPQPFAGSYRGSVEGTPATLSLQRSGDRLTGSINADGYSYRVEGQISGTSATGTLSDPSTGGALPFQATASGNNVNLVVSAGGQQLQMSFARGGGGQVAAAPASPAAPAAPTQPAKPAAGQRDGRLVGNWQHKENLGDVQTGYAIIVWYMQVRPDGTYSYGNDRSQTNGFWRTSGNIVHVSTDGSNWEPYAKFTTDGGSLMFTFQNGKRQLWSRM